MTDVTVTIPRSVLIRALVKARIEYVRVAEQDGQDPGPEDECWAEIEAVASYVGTASELIGQESRYQLSLLEER